MIWENRSTPRVSGSASMQMREKSRSGDSNTCRLLERLPVGDCRSNSADRGIRVDLAFSNPHNRPTSATQPLGDFGVATHVRFNFFPPKSAVAARKILARTSVPEAPVDEHCNLQAGPCKIWSANDWPMLSISAETGSPKNPSQGQLGRSIAPRTHRSHDPRPNIDRNMVHGALLGLSLANGTNRASDPRPRFGRIAQGNSGVPQRPSRLHVGL